MTYANRYARKAWDVIGFTFSGAAYCAACAETLPTKNEYGDAPAPVFVSDEFYVTDDETGEQRPYGCDTCGEAIE